MYYFSGQPAAETLALLLPLTIFLSQGHKYSPHVLLLASPTTRSSVLRQRPRIFAELAALIVAPVFISSVAAYFYVPQSSSKLFYIPVSMLAFGYTIWTYFHFSQQNYGIVKLYRNLNLKQPDALLDKIEHGIIIVMAFIFTAVVCTFSNERLGFYLYFFEPLKMPENLRTFCVAVCMLLFLGVIALYYKRKALNFSTFLGATHYFALTIMICTLPLYLGLLATSVSHWTQAIYLASLVLRRDKASLPGAKSTNIYFVIAWFLVMSSLMYVGYSFVNTNLAVPGNFGNPREFSKYDDIIVIFGLLYFGLNIGLNYTHFYLDRFIYRKNSLLSEKR